MTNNKSSLFYSLCLLSAAILWGMNFHFAKIMLNESSFIESATWRYIFGVVPLIIISWNTIKATNLKSLPIKGILLIGFVGLFGFNIFFFIGLQYTTPLNAALIMSLNPITTIILSKSILKTKLTKHHILGALVSLTGALFLITKGNISDFSTNKLNTGDLMILIANILFALHHVWVKQYREQLSNQYFTTITNTVCLIAFLFLVSFEGNGISFHHSNMYWISAIGIGCFGTALAYVLWNEGVYRTGANRAGIFMNIVPLTTAVTGLFLGESLELFHFVSGFLILLGIFIFKN